jgi:hypothetical protein
MSAASDSRRLRHELSFSERAHEHHEISFNADISDPIRTRADFTYNITPAVISITDTGLGKCSVTEDIEAVLRKIEYWHQCSISSFKIMCRDGKGFWDEVSLGRQKRIRFRSGENRRAKSLQETIGRILRPQSEP